MAMCGDMLQYVAWRGERYSVLWQSGVTHASVV
jgi:hypothetical protein